MIHVCSLARLHQTVETTGARHVVSLLKDQDLVRRPDGIAAGRLHLILGVDDISTPLDGYIVAAQEHVTQFLTFVRGWDRAKPRWWCIAMRASAARPPPRLCGVLRAQSGARRDGDRACARGVADRDHNIRIVTLADSVLGRSGHMIAAIETIGRGVMADEAHPFRLDLSNSTAAH